jgi:hypothetical protein
MDLYELTGFEVLTENEDGKWMVYIVGPLWTNLMRLSPEQAVLVSAGVRHCSLHHDRFAIASQDDSGLSILRVKNRVIIKREEAINVLTRPQAVLLADELQLAAELGGQPASVEQHRKRAVS